MCVCVCVCVCILPGGDQIGTQPSNGWQAAPPPWGDILQVQYPSIFSIYGHYKCDF